MSNIEEMETFEEMISYARDMRRTLEIMALQRRQEEANVYYTQ